MNILKFSGFVVLGSLIWNTFLTFIGYYLGKNWQTFGAYFRKFEIAIIVLIVIAAVWYINHKLKFIKIRAKK
jgi:membrane protein DedA with SNARE-associated domain